MTEIFVEQALQRAKQLDDYLQEHGRVSGPLHGLPISLKDQICIKGLETTMGMLFLLLRFAINCALKRVVKVMLRGSDNWQKMMLF